MIMTVHPVLVLLPILGLLVLPCAPEHVKKGLETVANKTVNNTEDCGTELCPKGESCPGTQNSSCGNVTNSSDLLVKSESVHVDNNQTGEFMLPQESSGTTVSQSSPDGSSNITQPSASVADVSVTRTSNITNPNPLPNDMTTKVTTDLQTTSTEKATTADAVSKLAITTIPTKPAMTFTTTTTPKPNATSPKPSSKTTSITTTSTAVAQTIIPKQPSSPSPSGTNSSVSISPLVPITPPSNSSTKPVQTSPIPTSSDKKPMPTTPKTSTSPSVVAPKLPKDIPKRDQAINVAGNPLTSHLLNTSSLLAVLLFGLLFFVVTVALFLKQAYESYKRKDYTQVDYLINGMYSDSGV